MWSPDLILIVLLFIDCKHFATKTSVGVEFATGMKGGCKFCTKSRRSFISLKCRKAG